MSGCDLRCPIGTVDGGRARFGSGFAEAVLILPDLEPGFFALRRRDVVRTFGIVGQQVPVYGGSGREVGYGTWEGDVFQVYAGDEAPLEIPARDLRGAVRALPKAGTAYRGDPGGKNPQSTRSL